VEEALIRILREPKNALTKQYTRLLALEDVKLSIDDAALTAIAQKAIKRGTGARGLRAIMEEVLRDIMFELPGRDDVVEVRVTEASVNNRATPPLLEIAPRKKRKEA